MLSSLRLKRNKQKYIINFNLKPIKNIAKHTKTQKNDANFSNYQRFPSLTVAQDSPNRCFYLLELENGFKAYKKARKVLHVEKLKVSKNRPFSNGMATQETSNDSHGQQSRQKVCADVKMLLRLQKYSPAVFAPKKRLHWKKGQNVESVKK